MEQVRDLRFSLQNLLFSQGLSFLNSEGEVKNSLIQENEIYLTVAATRAGRGGGAHFFTSYVNITDCNFVKNYAQDDGGAMYGENGGGLRIIGTTFSENFVGDDGGSLL